VSIWMWLLLLPILAQAADDKIARGAEVYRRSCGVPYCHGPEGKAGRAPGLAGRFLESGVIVRTATTGIPNTSMPGFAALLKSEDIQAVAAYIVSLNGGGPAAGSRPAVAMPADVQRGRALFFDAARVGACGACHEVGGRGVLVSTGLQDLAAARLQDLRRVQTHEVVTARPSGESAFPAVVVEKAADRIRVYDLSSPLPVLRSFAPAEVVLTPGASWTHSASASLYTDAELDAISRFLRWSAGQ
jgi:mono/diheme cytochrome c family protein